MKLLELKKPQTKEPKFREENDDLDFLLDGPDPIVVRTGVDNSNIADTLEVFYHGGRTYVLPSGEFQNASPWSYAGRQDPKNIKRWYLDSIKDDE